MTVAQMWRGGWGRGIGKAHMHWLQNENEKLRKTEENRGMKTELLPRAKRRGKIRGYNAWL